MGETLLHSWWVPAVRGIAAIVFALLCWFSPGTTILLLVSFFAAYALVSGAAAIGGAIQNRRRDADWGVMLLLGLVSVAAGLIAVFRPGLTALVLVLVMAVNALATGVLEIVAAIRLHARMRQAWLLAVSGVVSIAFGVAVVLFPAAGALTLIWLISAYALVAGAFNTALAYRLYRQAQAALALRRSDRPSVAERRVSRERRRHPDRRTFGMA